MFIPNIIFHPATSVFIDIVSVSFVVIFFILNAGVKAVTFRLYSKLIIIGSAFYFVFRQTLAIPLIIALFFCTQPMMINQLINGSFLCRDNNDIFSK